ncbi:hypothetical protein GCM10009733_014100 [Nonomuraea maheshkhaliensis]|uniref:Transposase n=1 Tax=Nonomuraea maheshkhaliensis TaxID=419590 RepID=A0ABN2EV43_9ACTN
MAFVKDLWTKTVRTPDGKPQKVKTARHGKGKRWLAVWVDPDGNERSTAYDRKADAEPKIATMGADIARGDYIDPNAGKVLFGDLAERWPYRRPIDQDPVRVHPPPPRHAELRQAPGEEHQAVADPGVDQ